MAEIAEGIMFQEREFPLPGEIAEAKKTPNGWVYRVLGKFRTSEQIPPEAIVGAWKVDEYGNIVGNFIRNPNYVGHVSNDREL